MTVVAAIGVAGALMVGGTLLAVSTIGSIHFDFDLSGLDIAIACDQMRQARTQPDPSKADALRKNAYDALAERAKHDRRLAEAMFTNPVAVDRWCASRGYG